jgi:pimeloyl-ACP methyl ester carboxylesterase
LRSGQQAAIGQDVVALLDALRIPSALVAGYDWGSAVPTITIDGAADGVMPRAGSANHSPRFSGWRQHRVFENVGHNLPQEAPEQFAAAVLALQDSTSGASS